MGEYLYGLRVGKDFWKVKMYRPVQYQFDYSKGRGWGKSHRWGGRDNYWADQAETSRLKPERLSGKSDKKCLKQESILMRLAFSNITLAGKWIAGGQEKILGDYLGSDCRRANDEGGMD